MFVLENTNDIRIDVSEFKGKTRVDIRRWYENKSDGEWKRTTKGLNMSIDEWNEFLNHVNEIEKFVTENSK